MKKTENTKECGCPETVGTHSMYSDNGAMWTCKQCGKVEEAVGAYSHLGPKEEMPAWALILVYLVTALIVVAVVLSSEA